MDDATALKRLKLLLKEEGALKIITPFHACAPIDPSLRPAGLLNDMVAADAGLRKACEAYAKEHGHVTGMEGGYRSAGHYHLADVKRIEENPNKPGYYTAYADDDLGTLCSGSPSALLARLTEHEA